MLDDPLISSIHARITVSSDGVILDDLTSTNDVLVNGQAIGRVSYHLHDGDLMTLGQTRFVFKAVAPEPPYVINVAQREEHQSVRDSHESFTNSDRQSGYYDVTVAVKGMMPELRLVWEIQVAERLSEVADILGATAHQVATPEILDDIQALEVLTPAQVERKVSIIDAIKQCQNEEERFALSRLVLGRAIGLTDEEIINSFTREGLTSIEAARSLLYQVRRYLDG